MNVSNYCEFLERIGHHVIESDSGYWFNAGPRFYEHIPPFALINVSNSEARKLFRRHPVIGLKYCGDDSIGKPSFIYACKDKSYDMQNLRSRMRTSVRRGLRNTDVRRIDFKYLCAHGMPLNRDTMERHKRFDPMFGTEKGWKQFCDASEQVEGAVVWGAFVRNKLAAYIMGFIVDGYNNLLHQNSRTDMMHLCVNHALWFISTGEILACPDIHCVTAGHETVRDLPNLDRFKVGIGYGKRPLNQVVLLHPVVKTAILNKPGDLMVRGLSRLFPHSDLLIRTGGTMEIARHSYMRIGEDSMYEQDTSVE